MNQDKKRRVDIIINGFNSDVYPTFCLNYLSNVHIEKNKRDWKRKGKWRTLKSRLGKALYEGTWRQDRLLDGLEARGNVSKYRLNQEKGASTHSCTV
ncbi:uncharacterized protein LOC726779 isoform X1 [Apis mellifera]|uniref:Uncharacterized protein LOC726779 isoform X1 n=1 Tax=Apis mellifera TaxID=7460 RepID=A0A7M7MTW7_APIME|nr:uncharacterized protein LOC726779 isoform X1 [Apis mellifera]|eukprot:XP_026301034.1 uncharacterized protein LOC726779 isoform X1 [Apis mellifera]